MAKVIYYRIKSIPDMTLGKYRMGNVSGIDGILEMHNTFLRQWNRKGILTNVSLHLYYVYNPKKAWGEKLEIIIGIRGEEASLGNVVSLMKSSLLIKQFDVECVEVTDDVFTDQYNKLCTLSKKELFIKAPKSENDDNAEYYSLADMEMNESGRLYQMHSLMDSFNDKVVYRIDLYPVDMSQRIRTSFEGIIDELNKKKDKTRQIGIYSRNNYLDNILKTYDKIMEDIESAPHFITNIMMFGEYETPETDDNLELLLDAAASEAVESGNYHIATFVSNEAKYNPFTLYDTKERMISIDGTTCIQGFKNGLLTYSVKAESYSVRFLPVLWCLDEVVPFFRLPVLYENEEIQRRKETALLGNASGANENLISVGKDMYDREIHIDLNDFVKHMFISGVPGSGKTNAMLKIVSSLNSNPKRKIPFLIFEPAKKEYRALLNKEENKDVILISPHMGTLFPIQINPFEFPKGIVLSQHIAALMRVFCGSFEVQKAIYEILDSAIEQAYINCGWQLDDVNDNNRTVYPTMKQVYDLVEKQLDKFDYDREMRGNISSFLRIRLGGLLKRDAGEIFNTVRSSWKPEEWLEKSAIIELEALSEQDKNFMVLLICTLIHETLSANPKNRLYDDCKLRHVIVIEEAHNIIAPQTYQIGDNIDPKISATAFIVKMLAEVRALGEGIIIADQLPTAMAPEVIKNTVTKFVLKMVSSEDRELVGQSMLATGMQLDNLITYEAGKSLFFGDKMQKPIEMQFYEWHGGDISKDESKDDIEIFESYYNNPLYNEVWQHKFTGYYGINAVQLNYTGRILSELIKKGEGIIRLQDLKDVFGTDLEGAKEFIAIIERWERMLIKGESVLDCNFEWSNILLVDVQVMNSFGLYQRLKNVVKNVMEVM